MWSSHHYPCKLISAESFLFLSQTPKLQKKKVDTWCLVGLFAETVQALKYGLHLGTSCYLYHSPYLAAWIHQSCNKRQKISLKNWCCLSGAVELCIIKSLSLFCNSTKKAHICILCPVKIILVFSICTKIQFCISKGVLTFPLCTNLPGPLLWPSALPLYTVESMRCLLQNLVIGIVVCSNLHWENLCDKRGGLSRVTDRSSRHVYRFHK